MRAKSHMNRECDRRSVASMGVIVYTLLVAVEKHNRIQFSLHMRVLYIEYYNMQSFKYIIRLLKCVFFLLKKL